MAAQRTKSIGTMHLAKGLEFRAVAVMACDDEIIPLHERIETVGDDADLQEVYDTERHLLIKVGDRSPVAHGQSTARSDQLLHRRGGARVGSKKLRVQLAALSVTAFAC